MGECAHHTHWDGQAPSSPRARERNVPGRLPGRAHEGAGRRRRPRARRPLRQLRLPPVRIAFDVSPLSHPRTGIGNYVRGSLAGLAEAAGGQARADRLRADAPAGAQVDPRGARRRAGRRAHARPAVVARLPDGLEPPRPALRRAFPRPCRRPPLQRLDGAAAAGRHPVDDGARPRAAPVSGVGHAAHSLDARLQVRAHRRVRPRLRQLGLHGPRCGGASARAGRAGPRRAAGSLRRVQRGRRARRARPAVRAQPRHARAAQESRDAGRKRGGRCAESSRSRSPAPRAGAISRCSTTPGSSSWASSQRARCRG